MDMRGKSNQDCQVSGMDSRYEAPRIEVVITAEDLEREVILAIVGSNLN